MAASVVCSEGLEGEEPEDRQAVVHTNRNDSQPCRVCYGVKASLDAEARALDQGAPMKKDHDRRKTVCVLLCWRVNVKREARLAHLSR